MSQQYTKKSEYPMSRRNAMKAAALTAGALTIGVPMASRPVAAATANMTVRSGTDSVVTGYRAGDDVSAFPASTPNVAADLTWVHPAWDGTDHDFDDDTRWIWHCDETSNTGQTVADVDIYNSSSTDPTYYVMEPVAGDAVELTNTFSIPGSVNSGTLYITADNGYEVWVNGTHVGSAQVFDDGGTDWEDSDLGQAYINAQSGTWISVESFNVTSLLTSGSNTLTVLGGNEQQSTADGEQNGTVTSNPGGVIYELDIEYEEVTCEECAGDLLDKYEFEDGDFVLEGDGDSMISYTPGDYVSKPDEDEEPMSVTFGTDYCDLHVLVKSGKELEVQSFEDIDGSFTVETANDEKFAISFVAIYCDEAAAMEAYQTWMDRMSNPNQGPGTADNGGGNGRGRGNGNGGGRGSGRGRGRGQ